MKSRRRWFRRRRRQLPPVLLPPLERLSELVDRVVTLLDEAPTPAPEPVQVIAQRPEGEEEAEGHVLFVPRPDGYRLLARDGDPPAAADVVELDGVRFRVLRLGPSPLQGDRRRCAFLEQESPTENRSPTSERGEPDRRDEGGAPG